VGNLPFLDLNYKLCWSIQCHQRLKISKTGLSNDWWTCLLFVWIPQQSTWTTIGHNKFIHILGHMQCFQFSSISSLAFLFSRWFAINAAALHLLLIVIFFLELSPAHLSFMYPLVYFLLQDLQLCFICQFGLFTVVSYLHCSAFYCGKIIKFIYCRLPM